MFLPIHTLWWTVFGIPISSALTWLYHALEAVPAVAAIGAYGVALILVTVAIKLLLSPLFEFQIRASKKNLDNQRKMAPELAEIKKKHKGDLQKQQAAQMALYKERGVNPLSTLSGCVPSLLQFPILVALYWVLLGNARADVFKSAHFLFVSNLNAYPKDNPLIPGLPIPALVFLVIPLLAAASTFVQSRMMQQPPNPAATEQEQQTQQMMKSMQVMMPLMILYFAIITPAGLGLYWLVSNCFAIIQQYRVNGWGGLRPQPKAAAPAQPAPKASPIPAKRISTKRTRKSTR
jgi:YidC/Oxa1 family membrane protein insertase